MFCALGVEMARSNYTSSRKFELLSLNFLKVSICESCCLLLTRNFKNFISVKTLGMINFLLVGDWNQAINSVLSRCRQHDEAGWFADFSKGRANFLAPIYVSIFFWWHFWNSYSDSHSCDYLSSPEKNKFLSGISVVTYSPLTNILGFWARELGVSGRRDDTCMICISFP